MRILIGTPSLDGKLVAYYTHAYGEACKLAMVNKVDLQLLVLCYDSSLHSARNELVGRALQGGFDRLLWIDADQGFDPVWVFALAQHQVDVVGAPVIKKDDKGEERYNFAGANVLQDMTTGLLEVEGIGCGFTMWSRAALELVWNDAPAYVKDDKHLRMVFTHEIVEGRERSEDITACARLRALGGRIWLDPRMDPVHVGPKAWKGNFAAWWASRRKANGAAAAAPQLPKMRKKSRAPRPVARS